MNGHLGLNGSKLWETGNLNVWHLKCRQGALGQLQGEGCGHGGGFMEVGHECNQLHDRGSYHKHHECYKSLMGILNGSELQETGKLKVWGGDLGGDLGTEGASGQLQGEAEGQGGRPGLRASGCGSGYMREGCG